MAWHFKQDSDGLRLVHNETVVAEFGMTSDTDQAYIGLADKAGTMTYVGVSAATAGSSTSAAILSAHTAVASL